MEPPSVPFTPVPPAPPTVGPLAPEVPAVPAVPGLVVWVWLPACSHASPRSSSTARPTRSRPAARTTEYLIRSPFVILRLGVFLRITSRNHDRRVFCDGDPL